MTESSQDFARFSFFRGRVALAAVLRGLGVKPGDGVAAQAFTCIAVPEAIMAVGGKPVYVDIERGGYNMDPRALDAVLTPSVRVVIVQHSFGLPADLPALLKVTQARGVAVVEDCAHTVASAIAGRQVGTFGAAGFYSFEASKPVFAGLGGSARSNQADLTVRLTEAARSLHEPSWIRQAQIWAMFMAHGLVYRPSTYWTVRRVFRSLVALGLVKGNYNKVSLETPSPEFQQRLGSIQRRTLARALRSLAQQTAHRRGVAGEYLRQITNPLITHPVAPAGADPVYGRYPMQSDLKAQLVAGAPEARVELADFYATPVHPLAGSALRQVGYEPGQCPNAEATCARVVSLPTGLQVTPAEIERAATFLNRT